MKEIGEKLQESRSSIGVSIEEAAEDLQVLPSQIEAIENGNMESFKDVYSTKSFIRDYSKYLGLSYEEMVDEFNEYLFDYTSRLSIDDIKKATKKEKNNEVKVSSPYTLEHKRPSTLPKKIFIVLLLVLIGVGVYFIIDTIKDKNNDNQIISYVN